MAPEKPIVEFLSFVVYLFFTTIALWIRTSWRLFTRTGKVLERIENGELYETSAQVYDIAFRGKQSYELAMSRDFFGFKVVFDHPRCVLADNVTLYAVDEKTATFVVTPPGLDVYNSEQGSFFYVAQYRHAIRFITMPIWALHRLAAEVGDPKVKVILLSNTGRCGSTILSQIFERCPGVVAISEPDSITSCDFLRLSLKEDDYKAVLRSAFRLLCKPFQQRQVTCLLIKTRAYSIIHVPALSAMFPDVIQLFMYRDKLETLHSTARVFSVFLSVPFGRFRRVFADKRVMFGDVDCTCTEEEVKTFDVMNIAGFRLSWQIYCYLKFYNTGIDIAAVKYDDIMRNPEVACRSIFKHCKLPEEFVPQAIKALEKDSQRDLSIGREGRAGWKRETVTPELLAKFDDYCRRIGIPLMSDPTPFPNTITNQTN